MESMLRSFLVLQLTLFFGIYFERIKCHPGFSSYPMRLLRLGVFICMLLILFIDTDLLPASLGMSMALLNIIIVKGRKMECVMSENDVRNKAFLNMVCGLSLIFFVLFVLSGCFLCARRSDANCCANSGTDCLSNNLTVVTLSTVEQQRMFGPFPDWNIQEGRYSYKLFTMRYMIDNDTGLRNVKRSWIAALYCDTESSDKYMLKYSIRIRGSENDIWQEDDSGTVTFLVKDGGVQSIDQVRSASSRCNISVSLEKDVKKSSYLKIKIFANGSYDELRTFVDLNCVD